MFVVNLGPICATGTPMKPNTNPGLILASIFLAMMFWTASVRGTLLWDGNATNGLSVFKILNTSTNLALPLTDWTRLLTNSFDSSGNFTSTIAPGGPRRFTCSKGPISPIRTFVREPNAPQLSRIRRASQPSSATSDPGF
jgi:hypothetical protein